MLSPGFSFGGSVTTLQTTQPDVLSVLGEHGSPRKIARRYALSPGQRPSAVIAPRAGVYILEFETGDAYVGLANNVVRRLSQHLDSETHCDFRSFCFLPVALARLVTVERAVIARLERAKFQLRNHVFASFNYKPSPLDDVVSPEFLDRFLLGGGNDWSGERVNLPDLRRRYSARYRDFEAHPAAGSIVAALRAYVKHTIPAPIRTEVGYWSLSCKPQRSEGPLLTCLNIHWQEVLFMWEEGDEVWVRMNLAATPLIASGRVEADDMINTQYIPGGADQDYWDVPLDEFVAFLSEPDICSAARALNVRLMRKGRCNFGRSHCLDLADLVLIRE
jgi:hypothetical protein